MIFIPYGAPFQNRPSLATPVTAAWLDRVDAQLVHLSNDRVVDVNAAGVFGPYQQITHVLASPRNDVVLFGNSGNLLGVGNLSMPGHAIGLIARARWFSGTAEEVYGCEGRVDAEGPTSVIPRGTAFLAITGANSDNAGTMNLWEGLRFPDYSGAAYSRILARCFAVNDDPGAMLVTRGRMLSPYGRQRNGGSETVYNGGEVAPPMHGGMAAGVRYSTAMTLTAADLAMGATLIYYAPVFVPERVTLNQLGFRVTVAGAGGTVARMAIYPFARGVLGAKIAEAPEVSVATTGDRQATVAGGVVLEAGMHMLALTSNGAPTIQWSTDYSLGGLLGTTNTDRNDTLLLTTPGSYGALPTTPTLTRSANPGWVVPNLWLTVS
jgi:hypothetical protein